MNYIGKPLVASETIVEDIDIWLQVRDKLRLNRGMEERVEGCGEM